MGIGDWGLGIGDWGLGPIPNPQSPNPNPQSPFLKIKLSKLYHTKYYYKINLHIYYKYIITKNGAI